MVGLKSVWITLSALLLLAACVPQTKQTACGGEEAYNSSLRKCVPLTNSPSSFITISSFIPTSSYSRYKNDITPMTFRVDISNPFDQPYTTRWLRTFNGQTTDVTGLVDSPTEWNTFPLNFNTEVGVHLLTVDVLDASSNILATHGFQFTINNSPRPFINSSGTTPQVETVLDPISGNQTFSVSISNNNSSISAPTTYRTVWRLSKFNVEVDTETDNFVDITPSGTNLASFDFDPAAYGVGSYILRARLMFDASSEIVDERQYVITVRLPDFGYVTNATVPLVSQDTIAFYGVDYATFGFTNSSSVKSDFCVTVSDPDGTYVNGSAADPTNLNMVVRFYKDGSGSPIYEGSTDGTVGSEDGTVCFADASPAEEAGLFFSDGSPTLAHYRTLTARVFDEQTGREVCSPGLPTCPSTYPVSWKVLVKPLNQPVTATFVTSLVADNITYTSTGTTSRSANIIQGRSVTLRFVPNDGIAGLEGYAMGGLDTGDNFKYSVIIKRGSTTIDTIVCKDYADEFSRVSGTSTQLCTFTWPSVDPITNAYLTTGAYQAYLQIEDTGSPAAPSSPSINTALTINAVVSANTNAPVLGAISVLDGSNSTITTAPEGTPITFSVPVSDTENNTYTLSIEYCGTNSLCTTPIPTTVGTDTRAFGDPLYALNTTISTTIPENVLGTSPTGTLYYRIRATDSNGNVSVTTTHAFAVTNFNADPTINTALVSPTAGDTFEVLAGHPFTGRLNTAISDLSTAVAEQTTTFQWWIGTVNDLNDPTVWTAIADSNTSTLSWTPGPEITGTRYIAVCYSDSFPRLTADVTNPPDLDANTTQRCTSLWTITPRTNYLALSGTAPVDGEVAVFDVPSENITYLAFVDNGLINIEKVERASTAAAMNKPMARISFNPLSSGTATTVKNLSIAASSTSLYVSYLADSSTVPNSFRAHVRRINISNAALNGGEKTNTLFAGSTGMKRKFGFSYSDYVVAEGCTSGTNCSWDGVAKTMTFDGTALALADQITVNGVSIGVTTDPYTTGTICSNCSAILQAQSFAEAINLSSAAGLQGITARSNGVNGIVTIHGMETGLTEIFSSTQTMTAMGKILYNTSNGRWYLPVANADLFGAQNRIQLLNGPDGDVSTASMTTTNSFSTLPTVSYLDNAWSADSPLQMYIGYVRLSGSLGFVGKFASSGALDGSFSAGTQLGIITTAGLQSLQLAGPIGTENPNVFISAQDSSNRFWVSRLNADLTSQVSYRLASHGADAADTTILTDANISHVHIQPARALSPAISSNEARIVVVSNNGGTDYNSYLFRWKTVSATAVFDSTTTFDRNGTETSVSSKVAAFAPSAFTFGNPGAIAGENTNASMGVLRILDGGTVEFNFLNSEVESINSTTNSTTGEFRAPYVK